MVKRILLLLVLAALSISVVSCSRNELARIPIQKVGQFQTDFSHPGGELDLWTDFDIEYDGEISAKYSINLLQDGETVETLTCDPFQVEESLMTREVEANGLQKVSFLALMDCVTFLPEGRYSAGVNFSILGEDVKIFRADLIFKQPEN